MISWRDNIGKRKKRQAWGWGGERNIMKGIFPNIAK